MVHARKHGFAITYGGAGGWFYNELYPSAATSSILLTLFVATNQAYFMGFFFLLAGYFTPASLERKGYAQFLGDRFLRLGLPLLVFVFILGPFTAAIVAAHDGKGFWGVFPDLWNRVIIINGPMWFVQALLMFCLGYCAWRAAFGTPLSQSARTHLSDSLLLEMVSKCRHRRRHQSRHPPVRARGQECHRSPTRLFSLRTSFSSPSALPRGATIGFANSIASRRAWVITLVVAWPLLPISIVVAMRVFGPGKANFGGGLTWPAIFYAFWDPFVAWGLIAAWVLIARSYMNKPSRFWSWLNRRAYAVYIIHPPVLVGISLLLHPLIAPAMLKFAVTGTLACVATWLIADPLVRIPGLRRVV